MIPRKVLALAVILSLVPTPRIGARPVEEFYLELKECHEEDVWKCPVSVTARYVETSEFLAALAKEFQLRLVVTDARKLLTIRFVNATLREVFEEVASLRNLRLQIDGISVKVTPASQPKLRRTS